MKTTELTDTDGDALTITQRLDGTWITCTKGAEEVTIGPIPTDAIRNAFEQPMGGDDMDGGVTAAAIEAEVDGRATWAKIRAYLLSPERARSLVHDRDEAARSAALWKETARELFGARNGSRAALRHWQDKHDHPLTADDITAEMIERGFTVLTTTTRIGRPFVRELLEAALTKPTRPEGAAALDDLVDRSIRGCSDITSPDTVRHIADGLAEQGVRAAGDS